MPKKKICVVKDCGNQVYSRGLCEPCCRQARRMICDEQTTWEELEKLGLAEKKQSKVAFFLSKFNEAKESQTKATTEQDSTEQQTIPMVG